MIIAILPVRKGSVRLPGKNVKELCGRPLMAWTIMQLQCAKLVDDIYVTTDSEEMAEIARTYGAKVLMREDPREAIEGAGYPMRRAIERIQKVAPFEHVLPCLCTSPLRKITDIDGVVGMYLEGGHFGVWAQARQKETQVGLPIDDRHYVYVLSDVNSKYLGQGINICIMSVELYQHIQHLTFGHNADTLLSPYPYYEVEEWQQYDIDTQEDFDVVETIFKRRLLGAWEEAWNKKRME